MAIALRSEDFASRLKILSKLKRGCHRFGTPLDSADETIPIAGRAGPV